MRPTLDTRLHLRVSARAVVELGQSVLYGDLDDIKADEPTLDRWFNIDAGFERDPNRVPANFQKRSFPFRVDGVRGYNLMAVSTQFGMITTPSGMAMRFVTFVAKYSF